MEISPARINVLVGRNNTGKSSLLEAICLASGDLAQFADIYYPSRMPELINKRSEKAVVEVEHEEGKVVAELKPASPEYVVELLRKDLEEALMFSIQNAIRRLKRKNPELANRLKEYTSNKLSEAINSVMEVNPDLIKRFVSGTVEVLIDGKRVEIYYPASLEISLIANTIELIEERIGAPGRIFKFFDVGFETTIVKHLPPYQYARKALRHAKPSLNVVFVRNPISKLERHSEIIAKRVEDIMKLEGIVPGLERFSFSSVVLRDEEKGEVEIPLRMMGDGFKALAGLLAALAEAPRGSIILLEEPEVHMHPGYIGEFVKYLIRLSRRGGHQVFISTHSRDLLEYLVMPEGLSREEAKTAEKGTKIIRMNRTADGTVITEEMDVSEARESMEQLALDLRGI